MEREGWIGNFDAGRGRHAAAGPRRAASSPTPRSTSCSRPWRGRSAAPTTPPSTAASGRSSARVAAAQEPDGYLNTDVRPARPARRGTATWSGATSCTATATCSRRRSPGPRTRPDADDGLLDDRPPGGRPRGRDVRPGRDRVASAGTPRSSRRSPSWAGSTGERRYVDQAALFVERRGTGTLADIELGRAYYQDDVPVREATVLRGHAVRANYLAAGAVDVAVETDDDELLDALTTPVGEHGRPPHLRHRRAGVAARGRGVRRRLRAARRTARTPRPAPASAR